jgi:aspartate kinase
MRENIPVYVLNSRHPEGEGTEIVARAKTGSVVSAITAKQNVAVVEIEAPQGINSELLNSVYAAFNRHGCPVDVMGASAGRLLLIVGSGADLSRIVSNLQDVAGVRWENHKALVCLVGENLRRQPEIASHAFAAVSDLDVRVICQGASDRTISFLVPEEKVEESVQRLHSEFFPRHEQARDWGAVSVAFCQP